MCSGIRFQGRHKPTGGPEQSPISGALPFWTPFQSISPNRLTPLPPSKTRRIFRAPNRWLRGPFGSYQILILGPMPLAEEEGGCQVWVVCVLFFCLRAEGTSGPARSQFWAQRPLTDILSECPPLMAALYDSNNNLGISWYNLFFKWLFLCF